MLIFENLRSLTEICPALQTGSLSSFYEEFSHGRQIIPSIIKTSPVLITFLFVLSRIHLVFITYLRFVLPLLLLSSLAVLMNFGELIQIARFKKIKIFSQKIPHYIVRLCSRIPIKSILQCTFRLQSKCHVQSQSK